MTAALAVLQSVLIQHVSVFPVVKDMVHPPAHCWVSRRGKGLSSWMWALCHASLPSLDHNHQCKNTCITWASNHCWHTEEQRKSTAIHHVAKHSRCDALIMPLNPRTITNPTHAKDYETLLRVVYRSLSLETEAVLSVQWCQNTKMHPLMSSSRMQTRGIGKSNSLQMQVLPGIHPSWSFSPFALHHLTFLTCDLRTTNMLNWTWAYVLHTI